MVPSLSTSSSFLLARFNTLECEVNIVVTFVRFILIVYIAASADRSKRACRSIVARAQPNITVTSITTRSSSTGICYDDFKIHDANTIMLDKELTYKKQLRITEHPNTLTDYTVSITITGSASRLRITCNTLRVKP